MAFGKCSQLRTLILNEGLEILGSDEQPKKGDPCFGLFYNTAIESVIIPASVKEIKPRTFSYCKFLTSVEFAAGSKLEKIGLHAFADTSLEAFMAPPLLREIGQSTFYGCKKLKVVMLNEGLEVLGSN